MMPSLARQRGHAMLMVMILGTTATFMAGALLRHETVVEKRAISESLAETRAYWAGMGEINYALSRIRNNNICTKGGSNNCDTDIQRINWVQNYLDEVCKQTPPSSSCTVATWTYPDVDNSSYFIQVRATAYPETPGSSTTNTGRLKIIADFPTATQSTLPVLNGLNSRLRPVELRFCGVTSSSAIDCSSSASSTNTPYILIRSVDRPPLS